MIIKAEQKNQRQTARKVRLVAEVIKEMDPETAIRQLASMDRRASLAVLKVLRQAIANATHNHGLRFEDLEIADVIINDGPTYKRWRAVSRGRAHTILKRTCHIKVELKTKDNRTEAAAVSKEDVKKANLKEKKSVKAEKSEKPSSSKKTTKKITKKVVGEKAKTTVKKAVKK